MLVPRRRRGVELLDDPAVDAALATRSLRDVVRSNALFGGRRAFVRALDALLPALGDAGTLLDVGTGLGDVPDTARRLARRRGVALTTIGVELRASLAAEARQRIGLAVCADGMRLPFPDRSVDVVTCSQVLHHFEDADAARLLREMGRVARVGVIVSDLRRSWLAAALFWLASFPLGFHAITRHDGTVSVLRGFTAEELRRLAERAGGADPDVQRWLGWRLTARWAPPAASRPGSPPGIPTRAPTA